MNRGRGHGARGKGCGETWNYNNIIIRSLIISLLMMLAPAGIENNNTSTLSYMNWSSIKSHRTSNTQKISSK